MTYGKDKTGNTVENGKKEVPEVFEAKGEVFADEDRLRTQRLTAGAAEEDARVPSTLSRSVSFLLIAPDLISKLQFRI